MLKYKCKKIAFSNWGLQLSKRQICHLSKKYCFKHGYGNWLSFYSLQICDNVNIFNDDYIWKPTLLLYSEGHIWYIWLVYIRKLFTVVLIETYFIIVHRCRNWFFTATDQMAFNYETQWKHCLDAKTYRRYAPKTTNQGVYHNKVWSCTEFARLLHKIRSFFLGQMNVL